jgi:hypothetical protein
VLTKDGDLQLAEHVVRFEIMKIEYEEEVAALYAEDAYKAGHILHAVRRYHYLGQMRFLPDEESAAIVFGSY